jgi:hypothetical protein
MELTHKQFREILDQVWSDVGEYSDEEWKSDLDAWVKDEDDDLEDEEDEEI